MCIQNHLHKYLSDVILKRHFFHLTINLITSEHVQDLKMKLYMSDLFMITLLVEYSRHC